ncbi:MAG TPA: hypothetical protein K8V56_16100 [Sporosarcina psychrophila]|uniref:Uncharacterized protein n=1 Tax=Sporosarcina psychrophila TaxID=1476 RepID=A0A921G174_SPOPS|nr:hypothetical protein [Sporosarcina psychrophila]
MFNSYNVKTGGVTTNTNINAVSGTLVKNHPNSFFKRFQLGSPYGKNVLSEEPHIFEMGKYREEEKINVVVLQVMLAGGDDEIIAEIVREKDYYLYSEELEE